MRKYFSFFFVIISLNLFAQDEVNNSAFSRFSFFADGGVNFNSVPTIGGSVFIGVNTNLFKNLRLSLSMGYSSVFDDNSYDVKTYSKAEIEGETVYYTKDFKVEKVEYALIPISLAVDYLFTSGTVAPFFSLEAGYSANAVEEQVGSSSNRTYPSFDDIPDEYKNSRKELNSDPFFILGIGAGVEYNISESFGLRFKYVFNYNDGIPNTNQFLVGVIF